ncbi:MAG: hypothetical protein ACLTSX_06570 [Collinsella sp.]
MPQAQNRAALAARELYKRHASNGGALSMLLNAPVPSPISSA